MGIKKRITPWMKSTLTLLIEVSFTLMILFSLLLSVACHGPHRIIDVHLSIALPAFPMPFATVTHVCLPLFNIFTSKDSQEELNCCNTTELSGACCTVATNQESGGGDGVFGPPQCRRTAFTFFVSDCANKSHLVTGTNQVLCTEFAKECAHKWKDLSQDEKNHYHELSKQDKKRYEQELFEFKQRKLVAEEEVSVSNAVNPTESARNDAKNDDDSGELVKNDPTESNEQPNDHSSDEVKNETDANGVNENKLSSKCNDSSGIDNPTQPPLPPSPPVSPPPVIGKHKRFSMIGDDLDDLAFDLFCSEEMPKVRQLFAPMNRRMSGEQMLDELLNRWNTLSEELKDDYFNKAMAENAAETTTTTRTEEE